MPWVSEAGQVPAVKLFDTKLHEVNFLSLGFKDHY